jgi:hypothetical protein
MSAASKPSPKSTPKFSVGQQIRLADHDPVTGPDAKPVPFYEFYRNLAGTVAKVFEDGTVSVTVDRNSLPKELRTRHEDCEKRDRDKWLDKLSDEERNRLTAAQKSFSYRYTLLVSATDILPEGAAPKLPAAAKPASEPGRTGKAEAVAIDVEPPVSRLSSDEIAAAEERHLQEILNRTKGS